MSKGQFNDERLIKGAGATVRGDRAEADADRLNQDGTSLSAEERRRTLRQDWVQEILPKIPPIPGFHLCWVTTTNSADPIYRRMQRGYIPVKAAELAGFGEQFMVREGEFQGCVACNEMLLFKIPNDLYQDLMMVFHHDIPLEQEAGIKERMQDQQRETDREGRKLVQTEGFDSLGRQPARNPTFV